MFVNKNYLVKTYVPLSYELIDKDTPLARLKILVCSWTNIPAIYQL